MVKASLADADPLWLYSIFFALSGFTVIWFVLRSSILTKTPLGLGVSVAFGLFATVGFIFFILNKKFFSQGDGGDGKGKKAGFSKHLHSYFIGIFVGSGIAMLAKSGGIFSVLSIPPFSVLSTATEGLSRFDQILADTVLAPFSETFIFVAMYFLSSYGVQLVLKGFGKDPEKNARITNLITLGLYIAASIFIFFLFHVALTAVTGFLGAVIFYRVIQGTLVMGDKLFNIIPYATILFSFEWGYHFSGNIINTVGWTTWLSTLVTETFGWFIIAILLVLLPLLEILALRQTWQTRRG